MKKTKSHNNKYSYYNRKINVEEKIEKRYKVLIVIIIVILLILLVGLFNVQILKNNYYKSKVDILNKKTVTGSSAPRGRIYDRNGVLIVDNEAIKTISYKKDSSVGTSEEIKLAYKMADLIEVDYSKLNELNLKKFWIKNNGASAKSKITDEEWKQLSERKITNDDIENLKLERITSEELDAMNDLDKEAAYIYFLMTNGYYYSEKTIKNNNITDEEYALVASKLDELPGFFTKLDWVRTYPYEDVFKSILGSVSSSESGIPYNLKDYYLSQGYSLNDRVGTSYLEYQYENYLKGTKDVYQVINGGQNVLIEQGTRGNDLVLTIDIELQKAVEQILESELQKAKEEPNTKYYNRSFVVITNPNTGEVLAMAGKQIIKDGDSYKMYDYTPGVITSSAVMGSVVKGASQTLGYKTGAVSFGEVRDDECIKIASTPKKCSWKYLGKIDDIEALTFSSNTYQFRTAMKIGNGNYSYDKAVKIDESAFDSYRDMFAQFGLGVKTEIDLPNEGLGYKGNSTLTGHLLDFSIGQYDTYTPIQLAQYIGTIANGGSRMQPYLLKGVYKPTKDKLKDIIYKTNPKILNKVDADSKYIDRVKMGFRSVIENGTGRGYTEESIKAAGKTGTSESFVDSDNDGVIDKETISNAMIVYAPYDNPKVAFAIVSPDIYYKNDKSSSKTTVNKRITQQVTKKYFEIYQ